jgi:hypothetical protein
VKGERIILFELNEVPFRVLDYYCRRQPKSVLNRVLCGGRQFQTYIEAKQDLSPWRTWPTLHRGVPDWTHQITNFGEDLSSVDQAYPPVWEILRRASVQTGVFNSLHTFPMPSRVDGYCYFVPDPFATEAKTHPVELEPFQQFVLGAARRSARNVERAVPWREATRLLSTIAKVGLRPQTMAALGSQLVAERVDQSRVVRRRTFQAVLAFDVFMRQLQDTRPQFTTFFTNHVASAMHRYWAATFPHDYDHFEYSPEWVSTYGGEIDFAMAWLDNMLGRLLAFIRSNGDYSLWLTSSMGQKATVALAQETQLYLVDVDAFMRRMGLKAGEYQRMPAMLPQVNVQVTREKVAAFEARLRQVRVGEQALGFRSGRGIHSLDFGHGNLSNATPIRVSDFVGTFADFGLVNVEIQEKSGTNAYHIPQGTLIVFDGRRGNGEVMSDGDARRSIRPEVSVLEIAPALLRNFGVEVPDYMVKPSRFLG